MERRQIANEKPTAAEPQEEPFHLKYRPRNLDEVLGQTDVVKSLKSLLKGRNPNHTYIFVGPAGTGKTTLARIMAHEFGCEPNNINEVDAANNSGIDAMRAITQTFQYLGFGDSPNRALIIDECHMLSKQAWQSLLKPLEEPPAHVFVFLCTTETGKLPETISSRGPTYTLKPLKFDLILDLLEMVADREDLRVSGKVLDLIGRACNGSPRLALVQLSQLRDCDDVDEAAALLESPLENKQVIDLCRGLVSGKLDFLEAVGLVKQIPDMSPESVRIQVACYLAACIHGSKSERDAGRLLDVLHEFSRPFLASDKTAPLLLALGNVLMR